MDTNQIKKFAAEARTVLKQGVANKLTQLGFNGQGQVEEGDMPKLVENGTIFQGNILTGEQFYHKWMALYHRIQIKGVQEVYEEAAYTWFNRLMAIRILEKNSIIAPILTFDNDRARIPQLVQNARSGQFPILSQAQREELMRLLADDNRTTEQFQLLITAFCQSNPIISSCFGGITDYTEILLPTNILAANGFLDLLNHTDFIRDEDYTQSELIGWLYQFYISEKKDDVFASFKVGHKAEAEDIPAATQIFTPNWIVRYMVENTLGRIYLDKNENSPLHQEMTYLVEPSEVTPLESRFKYSSLHELSCADLSCGSGHILNEFFNLLYKMYIAEGYLPQQAIEDIFTYNIVGVDLDTRAKQLSTFALLLKACQRDESFRDAHCLPKVLDMPEPWTDKQKLGQALNDYFRGEETPKKREELLNAFELLEQADNLGSIMKFELSEGTLYMIQQTTNYWLSQRFRPVFVEELLPSFKLILTLTQKYAAICMNPPYMGSSNMNSKLSDYVRIYYSEGKGDLCTVFVQLFRQLSMENGLYAFIIPPSWLFLCGFEKLREDILSEQTILSMLHICNGIFGGDFGSSCTVLRNKEVERETGTYFRLLDKTFHYVEQEDSKKIFINSLNDDSFKFDYSKYNVKNAREIKHCDDGQKIKYEGIRQNDYHLIPGSPIAYWVSENFRSIFSSGNIYSISISDGQTKTGNNNKYLRYFWEVKNNSIGIGHKWLFYAKGGDFRRWYGNLLDVINWSEEARIFYRKDKIARILPEYLWYKKGITWGFICSTNPSSFRILPEDAIFDVGGSSIFFNNDEDILNIIALLNSRVTQYILNVTNPTVNLQVKDVRNIPIAQELLTNTSISQLSKDCVEISKRDWDAHETSWDFVQNELVWMVAHAKSPTQPIKDFVFPIASLVETFKESWMAHFYKLHSNEENLNRLFIDIYGLQEELKPNVSLSEVTILQQGELSVDELGNVLWNDDILLKQLISYAVGVWMGRYRLDKEGLHIAHPNPSLEELAPYTFNDQNVEIDDDAIIPLLPEEAPFPDNASKRLSKFVATVFGQDIQIQNINYINECLGETIETYFQKHFWLDHKQMYQKRPIYWLFSSKKGAFQCLTYMHRMSKFTVDQIRTKYLLPYIEFLENNITSLEQTFSDLTATERRRLERYRKDLEECQEYHDRLHAVANQMIEFDLDDGVVHNYALFGDVLAKLK